MVSNKPDISNFKNCIEDAKRGILANVFAPEDPTNYSQLRAKLLLYETRFFFE